MRRYLLILLLLAVPARAEWTTADTPEIYGRVATAADMPALEVIW